MKKYLFTLLSLCSFLIVNAQTALNSASIQFTVTDVKSDDPQTESMLAMMKGGTMDVYFKENKQRVDIDMMGGMVNMSTFIDNDAEESVVLYMDMMGQKLKIPMSEDEYSKYQGQSGQTSEKPTIVKDPTKTKNILGYDCVLVNIKHSSAEQEGLKLTAYVTDKIQAPSNVIQNAPSIDMGGFPLEYTMIHPQMSLTYQVTKLDKEVDEDKLKEKEGYREMKFEEFMQTMGAFGGMGQ